MSAVKNVGEKKKGLLFHMHSLLLSICFDILFGLLLVFLQDTALMIAAYVLSGLLAICGICQVVIYLHSPVMRKIIESRLAAGLVLLLSGTMLVFNPAFLQDIFPVIWGISLLAGAFLKIQYAFDLAQLKVRRWWIMLIFASLSMVIGILALLRPDFMGENKEFVIGLMLVFEAVLDMVVLIMMSRALKRNITAEQDRDKPDEKEMPGNNEMPDTEEKGGCASSQETSDECEKTGVVEVKGKPGDSSPEFENPQDDVQQQKGGK